MFELWTSRSDGPRGNEESRRSWTEGDRILSSSPSQKWWRRFQGINGRAQLTPRITCSQRGGRAKLVKGLGEHFVRRHYDHTNEVCVLFASLFIFSFVFSLHSSQFCFSLSLFFSYSELGTDAVLLRNSPRITYLTSTHSQVQRLRLKSEYVRSPRRIIRT